MNKYYKLDSRKVTFGEYWNIVRSWKVIIPWAAKLLRIPMNFSSGLPDFESVRDLEVTEADFSPRARKKLEPLLQQCRLMGFQSPRFFTYESMRRDSTVSFITLLHSSGATVRLMHSITVKVQPPKEKVLVGLLSELRDGSFLVTSGQRQQFLNAPEIITNRLVGAGPERLLESHLQKLKELPIANSAISVTSIEMLDGIWDHYERRSRDFGMQRGIYVWMTPEEVAREQQGIADARTLGGGGDKNMEVLLQINQLRNKKSGWGLIFTLFAVSLILFIGAGSRRWSWDYLIILLGVLFVHELGHYLAMRAFNYQNVRMFFIPFFGAAVSGRNYNVAGWKKVVVSLMGPLPGIVLGIIIGIAGIVTHHPLLLKVGIVALLLNGSNLIPVLPLDGGWVFHTLLFSRHYVFDMIFRTIAALVLLSTALFLHTRILTYVGIVMLIGLPAAYRMVRIAADLKKRDLPPLAEDDQTIPPATAQMIIDEVKRVAVRPLSTKIIAQQTLQIFETLNARPPGWAATLGLLFVQGTAIAAAALCAVGFIIMQRSELRDLFVNAALMPQHKLAIEPWPAWHGGQSAACPDEITLVATFANSGSAAKQFQDWTNRMPATASLKRFGESVLLSLPASQDDLRKQWLDEFQRRAKDVFVDTTNFHAAFSLLCVAPDTNIAQSVVDELNDYLTTLPDEDLVPPWCQNDMRTPSERVRDELARRTYLKLQEVRFATFIDPEFEALEQKLETARTQGDERAIATLTEEIRVATTNVTYKNLERLRNGNDGPVDTNVIELSIALNANLVATNPAAMENCRRQLAQRMGQLAMINGRTAPADERLTARSGGANRTGVVVNIRFVSFQNIADGPPALADWLNGKRFIGFRYNFDPGGATAGESD